MEEKNMTLMIEMKQKLDEFRQEVKEEIAESEKRILDQYFLFESEYGVKIDAIFDAVTMKLDNDLEQSKKIGKLEERMDQNDVAMFQYEKRISALELSQ